MKSKKSILFVLVFCLVLLVSLLFVACNKNKKDAEPTPAPTPAHTHTWATVWSKDATNHWYECSGCSEKKDQAAHVYTDDHDTTCNTCNYVRTLGDHAAASAWTTNATNHWHACQHDGCTLIYDNEAHVYTDDHDTTCNTCNYVRSLGDHIAGSLQHDNDGHWYSCSHSGCTLKFSYAAHDFDDEHDTICGCGYVRDIGDDHVEGALQQDETGHWFACSHTGCTYKFNKANHTPQSLMSHDETGHWYECSLCGYKVDFEAHDNVYNFDDTGHWLECTTCGYQSDPVAHVYDNEHDDECNICGYTRDISDHIAASAWTKDATKHWHACQHDGCTFKFDEAEHAGLSEWQHDATNHWHACSGCDYVIDEAAHIYDDEEDLTCNTCGYERPAHTHSWATEWSRNETHHWHACSGCTEKNDEAAHVYTDDHDTTCNTCEYVRSIGDHEAAMEWSYDADGHWHACQHDGCELKFDYEEHDHGFCPVCGYMPFD